MWRGVIMQTEITFNTTCPNWCLSTPLLKHNMKTKAACFMGWSKHKTRYLIYNAWARTHDMPSS